MQLEPSTTTVEYFFLKKDNDYFDLSDAAVDRALDALDTAIDWPPVNAVVDRLWDDFVAAEVEESGLSPAMLVKPSGHGPILFALHYAPKNENLFQDFGMTADPSQPCIRLMATKMGIPNQYASLIAVGSWTELVFRRCVVPSRSDNKTMLPYKELGEDVLAYHTDLRTKLWKTFDNPLALLLGSPSFKHYARTIRAVAIPYSQYKIFGKRASLYVERNEMGSITRLTLPVLHPEMGFRRIDQETADLTDMTWNFVLACAGNVSYNDQYFQYKNSLHSDDESRVDWGTVGVDLIAFLKATRISERATRVIVELSDFPAPILAVLEEKNIQLGTVPARRSVALALARELCLLAVASDRELDWPALQQGLETNRANGFPSLKAGRETNRANGFPHLKAAREAALETQRAKTIEKDRKDLEGGISKEMISKRVAKRESDRIRSARITAETRKRLDIVGLSRGKTLKVERALAKVAKRSLSEWRVAYPLSSLIKGQYDSY